MSDNSKALLKALDDFEAHQKLAAKPGSKAPGDVCATYAKLRNVLVALMPFLGLIPVVGGRIAAVITASMAGFDVFCPAPKARRR